MDEEAEWGGRGGGKGIGLRFLSSNTNAGHFGVEDSAAEIASTQSTQAQEDPFRFSQGGEASTYTPLFSPGKKKRPSYSTHSQSSDRPVAMDPSNGRDFLEGADFADFVTIGFNS